MEYRYIRLIDEVAGVRLVELGLNQQASEGWRLLPLTLPGAWGILEREKR